MVKTLYQISRYSKNKTYDVEVLMFPTHTPGPQNVIILGDRIFRGSEVSMTGIFIRSGKRM